MTDILIKFNNKKQNNDELLIIESVTITKLIIKSLMKLNFQIFIFQIKSNQQT